MPRRARRSRANRQTAVPALGRWLATTVRRLCTNTPTRAQTRGCAHEGGASHPTDARQLHPDDGALQCTSTSWKCVRSLAHHNTEGSAVTCARRVACRRPASSRTTSALFKRATNYAVRQPLNDYPCSDNDHASRRPTRKQMPCPTHAKCRGKTRSNCKAVRVGGGATATGGADDRGSESAPEGN